MTKTRIKKIVFAILSALMFVCLLLGVGQSALTANAESATPAGVADTNFKIVGGTYGRTDPNATTPDGVKFNILPTTAGTDVTLTMMGAHRKYYGGDTGWWSGRMRFGNTTEIEARITTLRSPVNQNYEISFVSTLKGVYLSLTSDIVMKDGVPYINGSEVALEPVKTGDHLSSGVLDFRPTTKAGVVGSTPDCSIKTTQMFKLGELYAAFSENCIITDKATLDAFLVSVPDKYKERYTLEWVNELCKDFGANDDLLEFRFIGVPATGTTLTVYELNGQVYDTNPEATSGTKRTSFQAPRPILVQKDSYVVFEEGADVNLNNLVEKWCPIEGITTPTLNEDVYHTSSTYNCEWTDGSVDKREQIDPTTAKTSEGVYTFSPNHAYNEGGVAYFALKDGTSNGTPAGENGTYYFFARWNLVSQTNEIIVAKTDTLKWGKEYRLNEIFTVNQSIAAISEEDVSLKGYLNATAATGEEQDLGTLASSTFKVTNYNEGATQYSVYITAYSDSVNGGIAYSVFTFTIDQNLPTITYTDLPLIVGIECDLNVLFSFDGAELTSYTYKVNGVVVPDGKYTATEKGTRSIFCEVTDSRGETTNTTVQIEVMSLGLVNKIEKEIEKEVTEFFADPALPYEGVSYTTRLYKATDNVDTATPLTINSQYVFTESGEYKLLYVIRIDSIDQTIEYTTTYRVTLVEQRPVIQISGELAATYYTGNVLTLPSATAANSYDEYDVAVTVKNDGKDVSVQNGKLSLSAAGEYEIIYSASYGAKEPVTKVLRFSVVADTAAPEIYVYGVYAESYEAGVTIGILSASVVDDSEADIVASVTITKDGQAISAQDGELVLESGAYSIVYTAKDAMGHTAEQKFTFTVTTSSESADDVQSDGIGGCNVGIGGCSGSIGGTVLPIVMVLIPLAVIVAKRKEKHYD